MANATALSHCIIGLSADDAALMNYVLLLLREAGFRVCRADPWARIVDCIGEAEMVRGLDRLHLFDRIVEIEVIPGGSPER